MRKAYEVVLAMENERGVKIPNRKIDESTEESPTKKRKLNRDGEIQSIL